MIWINIIGSIFMMIGFLVILDLSPWQIIYGLLILIQPKDLTLYDLVMRRRSKKVKKGFRKLWDETLEILKATNRQDKVMTQVILSMVLMILGAVLALMMKNLFLLPVLVLGFGLIPFWYVSFIANKWRKDLHVELETALSVITISYQRSDSIITAIEENVNMINPPVQDIFRAFLTQSLLINANLKMALENLKNRVDSAVFHEWVDALMDCQEDKNLKSTLPGIVNKISDMRLVTSELDYLLYQPVKEFVTMAVLMVSNIPLMYVLNRDWFDRLMFTLPGKFILAICATSLFYAMGRVVRLTKPVEYQR